METTRASCDQKRFFDPGEEVKVTFGCDFGSGDKAVHVLMLHLTGGGVEVLDVIEFWLRPALPQPTVFLRPACLKGKREPISYGPERKGRSGKVKRW